MSNLNEKQYQYIKRHTTKKYTDEHLRKITSNLSPRQYNYIVSLMRQFQRANPIITGIMNNEKYGREIYLYTDWGAFNLKI